jgi:asparagine synthase (glutamine-hydrolysing)
MCGIAGLLSVNGILPAAQARDELVRHMARVQAHRGPDDEGIWHDAAGRCSLAHRRLSIIDTSKAGHQPMLDDRGRWVISFNGEIYNFNEIRGELEASGVSFRGRTDTEVLLKAIATWGPAVLPRLDGMFAFAAFDCESGQLLLARDAFGEKPLYYAELPDHGLAFASELQALESVPGLDLTVSADSVAELLMFQYVGAPRTIYQHVKKLPPGHWLVASPGHAPRIGRYFEFKPGEAAFDTRTIGELADELEDLLVRSLRRRLISDVPLGAFLSGGVDSSTVCALIRARIGVPLKTYSVGFAGAQESEHHTARLFARHLGTEHHEKIVAPQASEFLYRIGRLVDEPNADSSCLPTYLLCEFARRSVTVALSGDGGDEMFGGYGRYFHTIDDADRFGRSSATGGWNAGDAYYSDRILVSTEEHIAELFGGVPPGAAEHLRRLRESVSHPATPLICRLRRTDVDNYLPGAVLPKVDRMSMQHSLEVRTPFLNIELARFAERLPQGALYADKRGKRVLRELAYRYLPRELIDLPKQGFGIPMTRWAREDLLDVAAKLLESGQSLLRRSFGPEAVGRFMRRQRRPGGFSTYQVWALAMLESWLRHHDARLPSMRLDSANLVPASVTNPDLTGIQIGSGTLAVVRSEALAGGVDERDKVAGELEIAAWGSGLREANSSGLTAHAPTNRTLVRLSAGASDPILKGCTLIVPTAEVARALDVHALQAWQDAGVRQVVIPHPHRPPGTFINFRFNHHSGLAGMVAWWRLRRRALASWWGWSALRSHGGRLRVVGLPQVGGPDDVELSCRYAAFRGDRQMFPLPGSHEEIAQANGERYSIWSRQCLYNVPSRWAALNRYWLVEQTQLTRDLLPIAVHVVEPSVEAQSDFFEALRQKVRSQDTVVQPAIQPGDPVVVVTHSLQPGGAERQWCYLAIGLKQRGLDVRFLVLDGLDGDKDHYRPLLERHGISPVQITNAASANALVAIPRDPDSLRILRPYAGPFDLRLLKLAAHFAQLQPKAVFAQLDWVNLHAGVAAVVANVPRCVLSFRNYNPTNFSYLRDDWFLPCYQALAESPRIVLSGNSRLANSDYAKWLGVREERIAVVPNSIDAEDFEIPGPSELDRLRREFGLSVQAPVILGVFRLSEEKDPRTFLEVCAGVAKRISGLRVLIAGVGPLRGELDALITERGLEQTVTLLGRRTDVPALMAISSLLLLTSTHEGMPNAAMEAHLVGLPIVATRTGGTPEIVRDGVTGYLYAPADVSGLTEACVLILGNSELSRRMQAAARKRMSDEFSKRTMVDRYIALVSGSMPPVAGQAMPGFAREAV